VFLVDEFIAMRSAKEISAKKNSPKKKVHQITWPLPAESDLLGCCLCKNAFAPENYTVETIPSGCCGMAGSFGYEKEHYRFLMQIGELVLLPTVRKQETETLIAAPGTSCRHQIKDGCGRSVAYGGDIVAGVTMGEIAREAGMATGTLYIYFKNKEELINYLFFDCRREALKIILSTTMNPNLLKQVFIPFG
jgi:hypothetical protein